MNKKLNVIVSFFRYRTEIRNLLEQNFEEIQKIDFENFLLDIDKLLTDIKNEKQSIKKELKEHKNDEFYKNIDFLYNEEEIGNKILKKENHLKFCGLQEKYFKNIRSIILLYRIMEIKLKNEINEEKFFNIINKIDFRSGIYFYNLGYYLYLKNFYSKKFNDKNFIRKVLSDFLNDKVLNISTHFSDDYFKVYYFPDRFYEQNFTSILLNYNENLNNKVKVREDLDFVLFLKNIANIKMLDLQNHVIEMLTNLLVDFDSEYERKVAHYTNFTVAQLLGTNRTKFRLNSTDFMNDPSEGNILFEYLHLNKIEYDSHNKTFLSCFTFNHNSLNQFRLYGLQDNKPCTGVSLVYNSNFFFNTDTMIIDSIKDNNLDSVNKEDFKNGLKIPLFRCVYLDSFTGYFEVAKRNKFTFFQEIQDKSLSVKSWEDYMKKMIGIEEKVNNSMNYILIALNYIKGESHNLKVDDLKSANKIISPISFLFKHFAFQEEQECRMVVIDKIESDHVILDENDKTKSYIEYSQPTNRDIKNIYIGLASSYKMSDLLKKMKESGVKNYLKQLSLKIHIVFRKNLPIGRFFIESL
ncbi:hypothetical protein IAQ69_01265 [Acinetobacter variabilis]|uniref:DUF2971 domain-containing protein n=1 Tax=Acinetobacter variabilis TaxID=70346 RepID=A0A7T7WJL6_9GAMM|nr:hypothetical protein [Acinetobacter variabilis]QQN88351.1 hypothetical protein IAQ69_01265 [Acinetobacter variabilis]